MCYAPICSRCGCEFNESSPHADATACLATLSRRQRSAMRSHREEMRAIAAARAAIMGTQEKGVVLAGSFGGGA